MTNMTTTAATAPAVFAHEKNSPISILTLSAAEHLSGRPASAVVAADWARPKALRPVFALASPSTTSSSISAAATGDDVLPSRSLPDNDDGSGTTAEVTASTATIASLFQPVAFAVDPSQGIPANVARLEDVLARGPPPAHHTLGPSSPPPQSSETAGGEGEVGNQSPAGRRWDAACVGWCIRGHDAGRFTELFEALVGALARYSNGINRGDKHSGGHDKTTTIGHDNDDSEGAAGGHRKTGRGDMKIMFCRGPEDLVETALRNFPVAEIK